MASAKLKWALGISVVVNLFLIAGAISAAMVMQHHMRDFKRPPPGYQAWSNVEARLAPASRTYVRDVVKTAALETEGEMDKARALRQEAEKLASQEPYDAAKIVDLAEQARSYENMARARIETTLIQDLKTLPANERGTVAGYVLRPGFRLRRLMGPPSHKPDQAPAGTPVQTPDTGLKAAQASK